MRKNITIFHLKIIIFTSVKSYRILHGCVIVMYVKYSIISSQIIKFGLTCSKLKKALHILTSKDNPFIMIIIVNTDCQLQNHVFIMSVFQLYPEGIGLDSEKRIVSEKRRKERKNKGKR